MSIPRDGLASRLPLHPLLFAAYPVLYLYAENLGEVAVGEVVGPLVVVLGSTALAFALFTRLLHDARRAGLLVSAIVVPVLLFGQIKQLVAPVTTSAQLLLAACGIAAAVAIVLVLRMRRGLGPATLGLNVVAGVLVLLTLVPIAQHLLVTLARGSGAAEATASGITTSGAGTTRDIYYLVFDRYGSDRSIALNYGIESNELTEWLRERGFTVLDDSHANYVRTTLSLASTLNLQTLEEVSRRMGPGSLDYAPINDLLRDHAVGRFLREQGYRYVHLGSWFEPTRSSDLADENPYPASVVSFGSTFYQLTAVSVVSRMLGLPGPGNGSERQRSAAVYQFDQLRRIRDEPGPKFVFAHVLLPHPPYVFAPDGRFLSAEGGRKGSTYRGQLRYTNERIREFLEPLLALPEEERPIIVLQADEGPYPQRYNVDQKGFDWQTATEEEAEIKFGILDALFLPGPEGSAPVPPTLSSVNTFRLLFDRYFGADLPLLPDRSYGSRKLTPYDFVDVTDRLPSLREQGPLASPDAGA